MRVGKKGKAPEAMELSNRKPVIEQLANRGEFDAVWCAFGGEPPDDFQSCGVEHVHLVARKCRDIDLVIERIYCERTCAGAKVIG